MNSSPQISSESERHLAAFKEIALVVCGRLARNQRVRRELPGGGRLRIDRQLPFLCVYRGSPAMDQAGNRELVTTEGAYLFANDSPVYHLGLSRLCGDLSATLQEHFGIFLLIEIWTAFGADVESEGPPAFEIVAPDSHSIAGTLEVLKRELETISIAGRQARVTQRTDGPLDQARGLPGLLSADDTARDPGCCELGLRVSPIFRDPRTNSVYPFVLNSLRWQLATVLRKTVAEFTGNGKENRSVHFHALGPTSMVKAVRLIDQQLSEISQAYDFLLQVTPSNAEESWLDFKRSGFREPPLLRYRPLPYHPNLLKRQLFAIELERVEDPTLAHLFGEKQDEIDRQLTALRDLHMPDLSTGTNAPTANFLSTSLQLYGAPDRELVQMAREILKHFSRKGRRRRASAERQSASHSDSPQPVRVEQLVAEARHEIDRYHQQMSDFTACVEVSHTIAAGIMVSRDRLLVSSNIAIPRSRVAPLLHHEVGTHLLTYFNGRRQPFRQMSAGLAGYEALQEGLAVLSEYLVGGLTKLRMRTLAARVMAVQWLIQGDSFVQIFTRLLTKGCSRRQSYTTTLRVFRGGGLTKDHLYMRGLRDLLGYLAQGHDLEPLYVGKIGLQHVPYIQELRRRSIIKPPGILPRFLQDEQVRARLEDCRDKSVIDLFCQQL